MTGSKQKAADEAREDARSGEAEMSAARPQLGPVRELTSMRMIAFFRLLRISGVLAQRRRFQLSEIEWRIMVQLGEFAPLSLNGLAELLLQDRGQLSRAVKAMVERGLLSRARKPGGPEIEIDFTAEGQALHARMVQVVIDRDKRLTEGIPADDIKVLRRVIEQMIGRAEIMLEEEQSLRSTPP
jgi:DNA-binding MarR family transcriptional regulator